MAEKRKSIVDQSLIEAEQIREAFEVNAKEILTHAMGSEIEQMVKESLEEDFDLEDDNEEATDLDMSDEDGETDFNLDLDDEGEDNELDMDLDIEFDDEDGDELDLDIDVDDEDDIDLDLDGMDIGDEMETVDLTSADDSEVITVFKKMGPSDEIEVVRNGDTIDIKDTQTNSEYRVELGGAMDSSMEDEIELDMDDMDGDMDLEIEDEMESLGEGTIYEIEIEDEYEDEDYMDGDMGDLPHSRSRFDDEHRSEKQKRDPRNMRGNNPRIPRSDRENRDPRNEAPRTKSKLKGRRYGNPNGINLPESEKPRISKLLKENTVLKTDMKTEQSKVQELTENNEKLVGGLKLLRKKLQEVAVFNSNLTYSVRLMTENATTSDEKVNIIKRMDEAKTLKESKNLYKSIVNELGKPSTTTTIKESVENKLNETKSSGSAAQISESKVYVNPELAKMRELMNFTHYNK
jgi:hypothetical protein